MDQSTEDGAGVEQDGFTRRITDAARRRLACFCSNASQARWRRDASGLPNAVARLGLGEGQPAPAVQQPPAAADGEGLARSAIQRCLRLITAIYYRKASSCFGDMDTRHFLMLHVGEACLLRKLS